MYVVDWLHKQALQHPDKPALLDSATGHMRTYREVDERASRFAEWVTGHWKLEPGARVAALPRTPAGKVEKSALRQRFAQS